MENLTSILTEITQVPNWWLPILVAYLLGAIPFGFLITRYFLGYDIRSKGSGNIGMTNVMRTGGKIPGIATFLLDFGKGCSAVLLAEYYFQVPFNLVLIVAFITVLGHTRSVFLKFTGGKGVATNFGVWLFLDWKLFLVGTLTWVAMFLIKKISSLSALTSIIALPIVSLVLYGLAPISIMAWILSIYIGILHYENIGRLIRNEEKVLKSGKSV